MERHLRDQIEYYRERAAEYDDWWWRRGVYALPMDQQRKWVHDVAQVEMAVHEFAPMGDVLELACGTGLFTRHIVRHAERLTALDSSREVIDINRARLPRAQINYVVGDVFAWTFRKQRHDAVLFTYWLSHIPDQHLDAFWDNVRSALKDDGRVFLVDSAAFPSTSTQSSAGRTEQRTLRDGRSFTVMKRYWTPAELEQYLGDRGWVCSSRLTDNEMILYASVSRPTARTALRSTA